MDARILRALTEDARRSLREVAGLVGATPTTVSARLERLKEAGVFQRATLRHDPARLPGRPRMLGAHVPRDMVDAVLETAGQMAGVVEAVATADGRLVVVLHVRDLDDEEKIVRAFVESGATEISVAAVRRASGPPLVHLFDEASVITEACAVCAKEVGADPVTETVDARRVVFCCTSCHKRYLERYEALRKAAEDGRHSTSS